MKMRSTVSKKHNRDTVEVTVDRYSNTLTTRSILADGQVIVEIFSLEELGLTVT